MTTDQSRERQLYEALKHVRKILDSDNDWEGRQNALYSYLDKMALATPAPEPQGVRLTAEQIAEMIETEVSFFNGWAVSKESMEHACLKAARAVYATLAASPATPTSIPFGEPIPATVNGEPGRVAFFSDKAAAAYGFKLERASAATPRTPDLVIQRLPDWNYAAFLNETDASCIAIGETADEALNNGMRVLLERASPATVAGAAPRDHFSEQLACVKLDAVCAHLNHPNQINSTDVLTAVKLAEDAAEWARMHIERRGKENDELQSRLTILLTGLRGLRDKWNDLEFWRVEGAMMDSTDCAKELDTLVRTVEGTDK